MTVIFAASQHEWNGNDVFLILVGIVAFAIYACIRGWARDNRKR